MAMTKRWHEMSQRSRRLFVAAAVVEGLLKIAALVDLWRRPAEQVRGSKRAWTTGLVLVNSCGALPVAYFLGGRRRTSSLTGR